MSIRVYHFPTQRELPKNGGVREHCRQLLEHLLMSSKVTLTHSPRTANIVHTQSSYLAPNGYQPDVYTCHGGFVPPIKSVQENLDTARIIISVARWIVNEFFTDAQRKKTVIIPNGIDLKEWQDVPELGIEPGYFLWAKTFLRDDWEYFFKLAQRLPNHRFVTNLAPQDLKLPPNMVCIGHQPFRKFQSYMSQCAVYVSTGSEVCPTTILEAWACAKPVLAWNGDGNHEMMCPQDRQTVGGVLYETEDQMVEGALQLFNHQEAYGSQGFVALRNQGYTWPEIVDRTIQVYEMAKRLS